MGAGMSQGKIAWRECDRCAHREDGESFYSWAIIQCRPVNGSISDRIGFGAPPRDHADLCPDCARLFRVWWKRAASPVTAGREALKGSDNA